jgi:hypothetical protein
MRQEYQWHEYRWTKFGGSVLETQFSGVIRTGGIRTRLGAVKQNEFASSPRLTVVLWSSALPVPVAKFCNKMSIFCS